MPVNFFSTELIKIRERFNKTFGGMVICNIKTRQQTILAIVGMGLLERKISSTQDKSKVREEIKRFMRTNHTLNQLFNNIERSDHVEPTEQRKIVANSKAV